MHIEILLTLNKAILTKQLASGIISMYYLYCLFLIFFKYQDWLILSKNSAQNRWDFITVLYFPTNILPVGCSVIIYSFSTFIWLSLSHGTQKMTRSQSLFTFITVCSLKHVNSVTKKPHRRKSCRFEKHEGEQMMTERQTGHMTVCQKMT